MPETWFFIMLVERDTEPVRTRWYWARFDHDEKQSRIHDTFEGCIADAMAHGFTFGAAYHLVTEDDAGPRAYH